MLDGVFTVSSADLFLTNGQSSKNIFFSIDEKYKHIHKCGRHLSICSCNVFARYENWRKILYVEGSLPKGFYDNLNKIAGVVLAWDVGFKKIKVHMDSLSENFVANNKNIGSFFSGGVDSFYTFLKNKHEAQEKITHLILIHGCDIDLGNVKLFDEAKGSIQKVASEEGVELVTIKTTFELLWMISWNGIGVMEEFWLQLACFCAMVLKKFTFRPLTHMNNCFPGARIPTWIIYGLPTLWNLYTTEMKQTETRKYKNILPIQKLP